MVAGTSVDACLQDSSDYKSAARAANKRSWTYACSPVVVPCSHKTFRAPCMQAQKHDAWQAPR
eukprot:355754-Chlamydomonas_euryale.AAC.13